MRTSHRSLTSTFRLARNGDLRVGAFGEARRSSDAVAGGELVLEGLLGSFPNWHPWIRWARHVVGARVVLSVNRARDSDDWSATVGVEIEPIGALHAAFNYMTR